MKIKLKQIDYQKAGERKAKKAFGDKNSYSGHWVQVWVWVRPEEALREAKIRKLDQELKSKCVEDNREAIAKLAKWELTK
jgi:hypothetical protein